MEKASGYPDQMSIKETMFLFPDKAVGYGPAKSSPVIFQYLLRPSSLLWPCRLSVFYLGVHGMVYSYWVMVSSFYLLKQLEAGKKINILFLAD